MIEPRPGNPLRGTTIKAGKPRPHYTRPQRCIWPGCRAALSHDHDSPVCSCHLHGYRLEHDPNASGLVLHLLIAAYPDALNLTALLGASKDVVRGRINWLRRRLPEGHAINSSPHGHGYWYEPGTPASVRRRATGPRRVKP